MNLKLRSSDLKAYSFVILPYSFCRFSPFNEKMNERHVAHSVMAEWSWSVTLDKVDTVVRVKTSIKKQVLNQG